MQEGGGDVTNLRVPTLAYDDTSITLVWDKPENYADVANYYVYSSRGDFHDWSLIFKEQHDS
jgi:hypothetical protein